MGGCALLITSALHAESFSDQQKHGGEIIQSGKITQTESGEISSLGNPNHTIELQDLQIAKRAKRQNKGKILNFSQEINLKFDTELVLTSPSGDFDFKVFVLFGGRESFLTLYRSGKPLFKQKLLLKDLKVQKDKPR